MKRLLLSFFMLILLITPVAAIDYIEYPYYNATANKTFATQFPRYVIDHNLTTYWDGYVWEVPGYLRIDYGPGNSSKINNYSYYVVSPSFTSWNFEGTNDVNTTWTLLDSRSVAISGPAWFNYSVTKTANITNYRYYQTYIISTSDIEPIIYEFNLRYYDVESVTTNFTGTPTSGQPPLSVQFNDTSISSLSLVVWEWDFNNDGIIDSREQNPLYVYPASGSYSVNLTASNIYRNVSLTKTDYIHVGVPTVDFVGTPLLGGAPTPVTFTDLSTGTPTMWNWTFGDGNRSTVQNPTWTYTKSGTYTVSLVSGNAYGNGTINTKTGYIYIYGNDYVNADFIGTPTTGSAGLLVHFTDNTTWGNATTTGRIYNWSFGDGGYSSTVGASTVGGTSHVYPYLGMYTVTLKVNNTVAMGNWSDTETKVNYIVLSANQNWLTYSAHQVRFTLLDYKGTNIENGNITTAYTESSLPGAIDYLTKMYSIDPSLAAQMLVANASMTGHTGSDGSVTFTMHSSLQYRIVAVGGGSSVTVLVYPEENDYNLWLPKASASNLYESVAANLTFTEPNNSYLSMGAAYTDFGADTNQVLFYVNATNGTSIYQSVAVLPGTANVTFTKTIGNVRGESYYWGIRAIRGSGNVSLDRGVTSKGPNGVLIDLKLPSSGYYPWIALFLLFLVTALASKYNVRFFAILMPVLAALFWWFGWISGAYLTAVVPFTAVLGVVYYMKGSLRENYGTGGPGSLIITVVVFLIILQLMIGFINGLGVFQQAAQMTPSNEFTNVGLTDLQTDVQNFGGINDPLQSANAFASIGWSTIKIALNMIGAVFIVGIYLTEMFPYIPAGFFALLQAGIYILYVLFILKLVGKSGQESDL